MKTSDKPTYDELEKRVQELERAESEYKQAEKALRQSEEKYRNLLSKLPIGVYRNTPGPNGRFIMTNEAIFKMFGYDSTEEFIQTNVSDLYLDPVEREYFSRQLISQGDVENIVLRLKKKDGSPFWASVTARVVRNNQEEIECFDGIIEDITDRKRAEEALRESEERARLQRTAITELTLEADSIETDLQRSFEKICEIVSGTIDAARTSVWRISDDGSELRCLNLYEADKNAHSHGAVLNAKDIPKYFNAIKAESRIYAEDVQNDPRTDELTENYLKPLDITSMLDAGILIDGKLVGVVCSEHVGKKRKWHSDEESFMSTIAASVAQHMVGSDRKRAEEALRESEKRFRELFNSINDIVYTHDQNGRFLSVNPALCNAFGYDEEELVGRRISDFMKPEFGNAIESEYLKKVKKEGNHEGTSTYFTKEGNIVYIEYRSSMVYTEEGEPYVSGTGRDVTTKIMAEKEKRKLQEQLNQSQKMESVGTLAGGIAHNFNNILMGVQGRASLMMMDKDPSQPDFKHLKEILDYVKDAVELTKDLLGFARGGKYEAKPTELNALIKQENRMFSRTKKEMQIHEKYEKELWTVEVDRGQIQQVLLNLYVNAWQSMPGGGELFIHTEKVNIDEQYIQPFEITPGRYVKISVTDTGTGMDEKIREKIFDPFFSTKDKSQGSGLGLASVYGIIKNHGGFINVYSEKGEGTNFNIYLPASDKEAVEEGSRPGPPKIQHGEGTILLVDDEDMIINVGRSMLEKLGYRVLIAKNGREALDAYGKQGEEIDLVILDMIMPALGGGEVFDRLKEADGDVKVLLLSGYSINGQANEIMSRGCKGFLQKPFSLNELSIKVQEAL